MKENNNSAAIFIIISVVIVVGFIFLIAKSSNQSVNKETTTQAVLSQGTQVIEMTAKAGFNPSFITAKSNNDTTLQVKTNNTFDCSSSIRIPSLGISKTLPSSGTTDILIAAQAPGTIIDGTCSMGMYHFQLKFE